MSIMGPAGNQAAGFAPDLFRHRRNRLRRSASVASLILVLSVVTGAIGWHRQRSTAPPDYYLLFLTDLAEQHHRVTGTTTVVKENERALDYLSRLCNLKARRDNLPEVMPPVSHNGMLHFSFLPGATGWREYSFEYLAEQPMAPSVKFTDPSGEPLSLWVFSRSERALAIILIEQPVIDEIVSPGLRIIETINQSGVVAVAGDFKPAEVSPIHMYLFPLDKLRLDAQGGWAGDTVALEQMVGSVPLLFSVGAESATGQVRLAAGQSLARLVAASPPTFFTVAWLMRRVVFPVALLWVAWTLFRLRRVWLEWNLSLSRTVAGDRAVFHFDFFRFLTTDLVVEAEKLVAETADRRREEISRYQEELRRERFEAEVRDCLKELARSGQESSCDEGWLARASMAELEEMAAHYRRLAERHQDKVEREGQVTRERARQIQWLESEFAAILPEKRAEVASAWALYEQACAASDPGKRLETLKAARKLLPKEFRSDQLH